MIEQTGIGGLFTSLSACCLLDAPCLSWVTILGYPSLLATTVCGVDHHWRQHDPRCDAKSPRHLSPSPRGCQVPPASALIVCFELCVAVDTHRYHSQRGRQQLPLSSLGRTGHLERGGEAPCGRDSAAAPGTALVLGPARLGPPTGGFSACVGVFTY